ncbi:NIN-like protein, partial [Tanacetum coccineum]
MNKRKKAMVVNYNALSKEKRNTTEIESSREDIEQHYRKTMKKAAEELGVSLSTLKREHNKLDISGWQVPDLPQRKAFYSNKNQSNVKDNGGIQDPSPVNRNENTIIKANEIDKKFNLKHGTSKIKYLEKCRSICSSTACASTQPVAGPVKYVTFKTGNVILAFVDSWIKTKTFAKEKREYNGTKLMISVYLALGSSVITFTKITTV